MNTPNQNETATSSGSPGTIDTKLEVVALPVSDVDRAKRFYEGLGWRLDADFTGDGWRAVQFTPPGSQTSIHFGKGVTEAAPGSAQGLFLVVDDVEAARADLIAKGADVSEPFHYAGIKGPRLPGPDPQHGTYRTYAEFRDPDGNGWVLQEIHERLPGRGFGLDVPSLTELFREAEEHHGEYERTAPKHHWSDWYAAYVVARVQGSTREEAAQIASLHLKGPSS